MSDTTAISPEDETSLQTTVKALSRRLERVEAELALLRAEQAARRIDSGEEEAIPAAVARRVFVEGLPPIRVFREWRGITQEELAQQISSSKSYISQLETGHRSPGLQTLRKLARALDIPVELLME